MELELKKDSFLDDVRNIRSVRRSKQPEKSEGFMYLHNTITQSLFDGRGFHVEDIDFSEFTYDDLEEYKDFYNSYLSERISAAGALFGAVEKASAMFVPKNSFH